MIRNHPATLVVLLWVGKAMAQEHSTVGPVAEPAAIQPTPPTWRCIPNTDDGCLLTLVTGEMVLGFPVRVIPNVQVTIRLLSGVRRIYEWNRIKEGTPIPAAQLPIERSMIPYPKVPVSSRPGPQDASSVIRPGSDASGERSPSSHTTPPANTRRDEPGTASIPVVVSGMMVDTHLEKRLRSQQADEEDKWEPVCSHLCLRTSLSPLQTYRVRQADGLIEHFRVPAAASRMEVTVRPGRKSWYYPGVSLVIIGPALAMAGLFTAALGSLGSSCRPGGSTLCPAYSAAIGLELIGLPSIVTGAVLTSRGDLLVRAIDPTKDAEDD